MTCIYSKRQLENGPVSISCTVITFLTAELLPKLEVLGFKCCRLYLYPLGSFCILEYAWTHDTLVYLLYMYI